jgi:hypothetical protein
MGNLACRKEKLSPSDIPLRKKFSIPTLLSGQIPGVTPVGFALFALVGFVIPVPLLAWLDRPKAR